MHMLNENQISIFHITIPQDCKNGKLIIVKCIIEGNRYWFPTLFGKTPHLSLPIDARECGEHTMANTDTPSALAHASDRAWASIKTPQAHAEWQDSTSIKNGMLAQKSQ